MATRSQFVSASRKWLWLFAGVAFTGISVFIIGLILVGAYAPRPPNDLPSIWWLILATVPSLGLTFALFYLSIRNPVLKCPHCRALLAPPQLANIVVASGNCPRCGKQVLKDE